MMDYDTLIRGAADAWDDGHTQPFENLIGEINLNGALFLGDTPEAKTQYREMEYARGQVELILNTASRSFPSTEDAKRDIALAIQRELETRDMMRPAKRVEEVIALMRQQAQNVNLDDIELWMHLEHYEDDLTADITTTFARLRAENFDLTGDSHAAAHYWQATHDHVGSTLRDKGLLKYEWEHIVATFTPQVWVNDQAVDQGDTEEWDVSTDFAADNAEYVQRLIRASKDAGNDLLDDVLDVDDVFKSDPAAPESVNFYDGPFSIHLDIAEA